MNGDPGKKIVILLSFFIALLCFALSFLSGADFLYASFVSLCVMFVSALILLQVVRAIGHIMAHYLHEQNEKARLLKEEENGDNF